MKRIAFLSRLNKEEKLKITLPSEEIKVSYTIKSKSSLRSASILLENGQLEDSTAMIYYSMYNILTALLHKTGIKCENHAAAIILLKELFIIDNSKISFAKTERIDKQYYVDYKVSKEEVEDLMIKADEFNAMLYDFMEKLTSKDLARYRDQLKHALGIEKNIAKPDMPGRSNNKKTR